MNPGTLHKQFIVPEIYDKNEVDDLIAGIQVGATIIRYSTSNPTSGQGNNGDFWINTATTTWFGPKTSGVWPTGVSLIGPVGPPGEDGAVWYIGDNVPSVVLGSAGSIGDLYLRSNGEVWVKTGMPSTWTNTGIDLTGDQGVQGIPGPDGQDGADGLDGSRWYSGVNAPTTQGVSGDFYLQASGQVWAKTGSTWAATFSLIGPPGSNGDDGTIWWTGANWPGSQLGNDGVVGDLYLRSNGEVWRKTALPNSWDYLGFSLVGPPGLTGPPGDTGPKGDTGPQGLTGPQWSPSLQITLPTPTGTGHTVRYRPAGISGPEWLCMWDSLRNSGVGAWVVLGGSPLSSVQSSLATHTTASVTTTAVMSNGPTISLPVGGVWLIEAAGSIQAMDAALTDAMVWVAVNGGLSAAAADWTGTTAPQQATVGRPLPTTTTVGASTLSLRVGTNNQSVAFGSRAGWVLRATPIELRP